MYKKVTVRYVNKSGVRLHDVFASVSEVQIREGMLYIFFDGGHAVYGVGDWSSYVLLKVGE